MKPLVYYNRWQGAALRLRGRDETAVWGQFVYTTADGQETTATFHFLLKEWQLKVQNADGEDVLQLDEMGTVVDAAPGD